MQAEINIGMLGHVDHGKTTLTKAMTGKWTDTHSEELKRGITIRMGYADAPIYFCKKCNSYSFEETCECGEKGVLKRKISIIDAPGHETLMTTAIAASSLMDGAIFLIAANEDCPQPQTEEHMEVLKAMGINKIVVVQTKVDLVKKEKAMQHYKKIREFLEKSHVPDAPIIPVSAHHRINLDALAEAIEKYIPTPKRDEKANLRMFISRSFDINKPGTPIEKLKGGALGGSVVSGKISVGQEVELRPGIAKKEGGEPEPISFKVVSLREEDEELKEAKPGGLIAVGTTLDPNLTKSDGLAGSVISEVGKGPQVLKEVSLKYEMLPRKDVENKPLTEREIVAVVVHTSTAVGVITNLKGGIAKIRLKKPVAVDKGMKAAIIRRFGQRWKLSAWAEVI